MKTTYKIGDRVRYRGGWGSETVSTTVIEHIELCEDGEKYGESVPEIDDARKNNCVFDLSNGHWCYGWQILGKALVPKSLS